MSTLNPTFIDYAQRLFAPNQDSRKVPLFFEPPQITITKLEENPVDDK